MLRRSFRTGLLVGVLGGAAAALVKAFQGRPSARSERVAPAPWTPLPDAEPVVVPPKVEAEPAPRVEPPAPPAPPPAPPRPKVEIADLQEGPGPVPAPAPTAKKATAKKPAVKKPAAPPPWVEPGPSGEAPETHPIKAKLSSGIFHVPGGLNYARTRPDRCYRDAAAAEADGLRPSKR